MLTRSRSSEMKITFTICFLLSWGIGVADMARGGKIRINLIQQQLRPGNSDMADIQERIDLLEARCQFLIICFEYKSKRVKIATERGLMMRKLTDRPRPAWKQYP